MALDDKKPVVVIPYIDPHTNDRMPNIILSRYHVISEPRPGMIRPLIDYCETIEKQFSRLGMDSKNALFGKEPANEIKELIETIISDPKAIEFICNVVIPAKHGHMIPEIRDSIPDLLKDISMWDVYEPFASRKKDATNIDFFHVDATTHSGELRVGFSPQLSSRFRVGWHQVGIGSLNIYPLQDSEGNDLTRVEQPEPLTFVLWEASSGVHDIPELDESLLSDIGGQRDFGSLTFNFDRVVQRAKDMLHERNSQYVRDYRSGGDEAPAIVID
ncbi:MAG: hypothetical protein U0R17_04420 [Acidimicrobiia bacterium]